MLVSSMENHIYPHHVGGWSINKPKLPSYKCQEWWLMRADFGDMVVKSWSKHITERTSIDIWQQKIRWIGKDTKGWSWNIEAEIRRLKTSPVKKYDSG